MLLLTALIASAQCTGAGSPAQMLDAYRAAVGAPAKSSGTLISRYTYSGSGLSGEVISTIDLGIGRFKTEELSGIVSEARGFDGETAWSRDLSMFVKPQTGGDGPALAINQAYRNANLWWRADRGRALLEPLGCDGIRVTPKGGKAFEAWFDPATHLLARLREKQSFGSVADTTFADYQRRNGWLTPTRIEISYGGGTPDVLRLTSATRLGNRSVSQFSIPTAQPRDWTLSGDRTSIPFQLLNNHIIVDVSVDGHGPFPFLIDTGGHNILTPSTVRALGVETTGSAQSGGAGEKSVTNGYTRIRSIAAGGATLFDQTAIALDFSPPSVEGLELGGMLGVEFLERFVVRIDYGTMKITFIEPKAFGPAERARSGAAIPLRFYDHMPQVVGQLDGRRARFNIDTGARDEVTLTSPFVANEDLRHLYPQGIEMTTGWGVGGPSRTYTARAGTMSVGPIEIRRPVIGLSSAMHGSFSDDSYEGNVGTGLLKRFVTTFDYSRRSIYLKQIAKPDPDTGRFDRSGMWINLAGDGFEIMDVAPGGPAERAGLRVSDVITSIGSMNPHRNPLSEVRKALRLAPVAEPIDVRYRRGPNVAETRILPRDLIPD